jgi:hypothetical protein
MREHRLAARVRKELNMTTDARLAEIIRMRAAARRSRERAQRPLLPEDNDYHETIRMKLDGLWDCAQFWNYSKCGHERIFRTCRECGDVQEFPYRCSLKFCPRCQWWITEKRRRVIAKWSSRITQPKHLVLTQRNFPILTRRKFSLHTKALSKMRRSKCFESVSGGCVSIEVTNETRGWHVHSHWLIDCRWLDMAEVSRTWGQLVGQEFSIVKIKDARAKDYLQEVSKYVCEGSELARWPAEQILEFVTAIRGRRFFFAFGSLFHEGKAIRAEIVKENAHSLQCECGCCDFIFEDETTSILREIRTAKKKR